MTPGISRQRRPIEWRRAGAGLAASRAARGDGSRPSLYLAPIRPARESSGGDL